jgi:NADH-quinone oxidoreductase subunit A
MLDTALPEIYSQMFQTVWLRATIYSTFMPDFYFARYLPLLIHMVIAFALAGAIVILSTLVGRHRYSRAKFQPYECGMAPVGDARERFPVKFYLVAMLFILFDVEAVFLYPWAILLKELKMFGFWEMLVYIGVVLVGFFYIWKKGVLEWAEVQRKRPVTAATAEFLRVVTGGPTTGTADLVEVGGEKP